MEISKAEIAKRYTPDEFFDLLLNIVSHRCSVPAHQIIAPDKATGSRRSERVVARRYVMMFLKELTFLSLAEIGRRVGNRDHSTVIHALQAFEDSMYDPARKLQTKKDVLKIIELIEEHINKEEAQILINENAKSIKVPGWWDLSLV